jgi:hypothetical protein
MNGVPLQWWRCGFIVFAIALTLGTHWPRLELGSSPAGPDPDTTAHFLAFGGLMLLLCRTRWLPNPWWCAALVLSWTVLDELSQAALPVLGRSASWQDALAGQLGVLAALAWSGGRARQIPCALRSCRT